MQKKFNFLLILIMVSLTFLTACSVIKESESSFDEFTKGCEQKALELTGRRIIAKVDTKTYPPQHGTVLPSCTYEFPDAKIDFQKISSCNTIPGTQIGENKNYMYGSLGVTALYSRRKITNSNGTIIGNEGFRYRVDFPNIEKMYPNDVKILDPIFHQYEFNITNVTFYDCNFHENDTI